jgi:hypothetical protein
MNIDLCRPEDNDLRVAVACLEMEISDSILEDLLAALADRQKDETNTSSVTLLLQAMDTVAHHIDSLRVNSSLRAFSLINELWDAYAEVTNGQEAEQAQATALTMNSEVLHWQQQCLIDQTNRQPVKKAAGKATPSPAVAQLLQEQVKETGSMIRVEMAALKELARNVSGAAVKEQVTAAITEQVESLQEYMSREISALRREMKPDSEAA